MKLEPGTYVWHAPDGARVEMSAAVVEAIGAVGRAFPDAKALWWRRGKGTEWNQVTWDIEARP